MAAPAATARTAAALTSERGEGGGGRGRNAGRRSRPAAFCTGRRSRGAWQEQPGRQSGHRMGTGPPASSRPRRQRDGRRWCAAHGCLCRWRLPVAMAAVAKAGVGAVETAARGVDGCGGSLLRGVSACDSAVGRASSRDGGGAAVVRVEAPAGATDGVGAALPFLGGTPAARRHRRPIRRKRESVEKPHTVVATQKNAASEGARQRQRDG